MVAVLLLVNVTLGYCLLRQQASNSYSELQKVNWGSMNFKDLSIYFGELAEDKGGVYAFEILKRASLPPNIDIHLLGHTIGNILYKQEGIEGIMLCTQDFRNACSHTIVVGTLLERGPSAFSEMADICKRAPGGKGAYTMCFHGLGHGVLAYNEYEFPGAVEMCVKHISGRRESSECVGGVMMEMTNGIHDVDLWKKKAEIYFIDSDPLYPCSADFVPNEYKPMCYTYLTPHLFEMAGGSEARPKPADFDKAFDMCESLIGDSRKACFGGIGKEFPTLAQDRDIRIIDQMSDDKFATVIDWCDLADSRDGKEYCITSILQSVLWGGENDPMASVRFCTVAHNKGFGEACMNEFVGAIEFYIKDTQVRRHLCDSVPSVYKDACETTLI
jgi:hypothetical protein